MEDINNVGDRKVGELYTGNEIDASYVMFSSKTTDLTNKHNIDKGDVQNEDNNVWVSPSGIKYKLYDQSPWGREKLSRNDENDKLKDAQSVNNHFSGGRETGLGAYLQKDSGKRTGRSVFGRGVMLSSQRYNPGIERFNYGIEKNNEKELKKIYENVLSNLCGAFASIPEDLTNKHVRIIYKGESGEDKEVNLGDRGIVVQGDDRDYSVRYDFPEGSQEWAYFERKHNGGIVGSYSVKEGFFDCINKIINNKDKCEIIVEDR